MKKYRNDIEFVFLKLGIVKRRKNKMGQIANQMALELFFKMKGKIKAKKEKRENQKR